MELLGRDQRKPLGEVKPHLMTEHGARTDACAVKSRIALIQRALQQFKILTHNTWRISCLMASLAILGRAPTSAFAQALTMVISGVRGAD